MAGSWHGWTNSTRQKKFAIAVCCLEKNVLLTWARLTWFHLRNGSQYAPLPNQTEFPVNISSDQSTNSQASSIIQAAQYKWQQMLSNLSLILESQQPYNWILHLLSHYVVFPRCFGGLFDHTEKQDCSWVLLKLLNNLKSFCIYWIFIQYLLIIVQISTHLSKYCSMMQLVVKNSTFK